MSPARLQTFDLSFGQAQAFYPEAGPKRCTVALRLDIEPLHLAQTRHTPAGHDFLPQPYINDRPYVASPQRGHRRGFRDGAQRPLPSAARTRRHATTLAGPPRRPALLQGQIRAPMPVRAVGLSCSPASLPLDGHAPEWGDSDYCPVILSGTIRLRDLLSHAYVLVPVLDDEKHYWIGDDEVAKLLRRGEGWLARHPRAGAHRRGYLNHQRTLTNAALAQLADEDDVDPAATDAV